MTDEPATPADGGAGDIPADGGAGATPADGDAAASPADGDAASADGGAAGTPANGDAASTAGDPPDCESGDPRPSLTFQESMTGFLLCGPNLTYPGEWVTVDQLAGARCRHPLPGGLDFDVASLEAADREASENGMGASYHLTICYDDWRREADGDGSGRALRDLGPAKVTHGWVEIKGITGGPAGLPGRPLEVTDGRFYLRVANPRRVETDHMLYILRLKDPQGGACYDFFGFKVLRPGVVHQSWAATTTNYVAVFDAGSDRCRAAGIMHISVPGVAELLQSMHVENGSQLTYVTRFGWKFAHPAVRLYGGALAESSRLVRPKSPPRRSLPPGSTGVWQRGRRGPWHEDPETDEGACLRLTRYPRRDGGSPRYHPVLLVHGYGMSARSFSWPTDEKRSGPAARSLTGHLQDHGYEVWLLDNRGSIDLPSSSDPFNLDDIALDDWPAAVAQVQKVAGSPVHAFGHCVGSGTLLMAMLSDLPGIKSATCSQFTTHLLTSRWNVLKADVWLGRLLEGALVKRLRPDSQPGLTDALFDVAMAPLPLPQGERCGLALCRWINAIYGLTHTHSQLDEATHRALPDLFGVAAVPGLDHLQEIVRARHLVDHRGNEVYLGPARKGGIDVPLHVIYGEKNFIFSAEGNRKSVEWLERTFPEAEIKTSSLPAYAHLDAMIGPRAATEVFPEITAFLDEFD